MKSGFVCILGRPNAGKSTLLNALVGEKLAIVTHKPQTTRNRIQGVINVPKQKGGEGKKTRPAAQIILVDTPGVHRSQTSLDKKMMQEIRDALHGCDLVLVIVDASHKSHAEDKFVFDLVRKFCHPAEASEAGAPPFSRSERVGVGSVDTGRVHHPERSESVGVGSVDTGRVPHRDPERVEGEWWDGATPVFLLLNKVDLVEKGRLLPIIEQLSKQLPFREIIPISALKRDGLGLLLSKIVEALPKGSKYFPQDQVTDQPARFLAAEIIREQVLLQTAEEVPYAATVVIEEFQEAGAPPFSRSERVGNLTRILATIYCERDGQKGIIIGKGGSMLKKIGTAARQEIEQALGTKVYLELFVKVRPGWREQREFIEGLDWRRQLAEMVRREKH